MNARWVSVVTFWMQLVMMNLKKMFDREVIIHLRKETEKVVLLQVKDLMQIFVKFRTEKISLHVSFEGYWHVNQQKYFGAIVSKGTNWKFMVSWQKSNLPYFTNSKDSFQVLKVVHDFWKKYYLQKYEVHVFSPSLVVHKRMYHSKCLRKQGIRITFM